MDIQIEYDGITKELEYAEAVRLAKQQLNQDEKRLEKIVRNTNEVATVLELINLKFNIALNEICDGNKTNGINKLNENIELSKLLDKKEDFYNLLWIILKN